MNDERDAFAAFALQGMLANHEWFNDIVRSLKGPKKDLYVTKEDACAEIARLAYMMSDAMMKEREKWTELELL